MAEWKAFSVMLIPEGGGESRTIRVSGRRLRLLVWGASVAAVLLLAVVGSWWYFALRAARTAELEAEVERLQVDRARLAGLAAELQELERRYAQIRGLFGSDSTAAPSDLWLPPPGSGRPSSAAEPDPESALPTSWPLTERGFLTQPLLEGAAGDHPGIDIAVATDSYIRAAGAGTVVQATEDEVYGRFVVVDHGNGYVTRYAHASMLTVEPGRHVRRNEVIGLTGSTGRSTAPHLHFEIVLDGEAVDPLTLVEPPA